MSAAATNGEDVDAAAPIKAVIKRLCRPGISNPPSVWNAALTVDPGAIQPKENVLKYTPSNRWSVVNIVTSESGTDTNGNVLVGPPLIRVGSRTAPLHSFGIGHGCTELNNSEFDSLPSYAMYVEALGLPDSKRDMSVVVPRHSDLYTFSEHAEERCKQIWDVVASNTVAAAVAAGDTSATLASYGPWHPCLSSPSKSDNGKGEMAGYMSWKLDFDDVHILYNEDDARVIKQKKDKKAEMAYMTADKKKKAYLDKQKDVVRDRKLYVYLVSGWNGEEPICEEIFDVRSYICAIKKRKKGDVDIVPFKCMADISLDYLGTRGTRGHGATYYARKLYIIPTTSAAAQPKVDQYEVASAEDAAMMIALAEKYSTAKKRSHDTQLPVPLEVQPTASDAPTTNEAEEQSVPPVDDDATTPPAKRVAPLPMVIEEEVDDDDIAMAAAAGLI